MADTKEYRIRVHNTLVTVTREVYRVYYSERRYEKTLKEKDERNGLVSYNALDMDGILGEDMIPDADAPSVDEIVVTNILVEKLRRCLAMLSTAERELMDALYFEGLSERQLSRQTDIPQKTIHDRKVRVLRKLRKLMDK